MNSEATTMQTWKAIHASNVVIHDELQQLQQLQGMKNWEVVVPPAMGDMMGSPEHHQSTLCKANVKAFSLRSNSIDAMKRFNVGPRCDMNTIWALRSDSNWGPDVTLIQIGHCEAIQ